MQTDMHYYATYAMARSAGLSVSDSATIAYAAQYVDDATTNTGLVHADGGMFQTVATAHTNSEAIKNAVANHIEQREVWVPFHFFPGNQGKSYSERMLCVKDSPLVNEMISHHIQHAAKIKNEFGLQLLGIAAHAYADTFSHYGFSGMSSRWNRVDGNSFELDVKDSAMKAYILNKFTRFLTKYSSRFLIKNFRSLASQSAELTTGALGHGAVGTYPDRPYLRWRFNYEYNRKDSGWRDNKTTYLDACDKMHRMFCRYALKANVTTQPVLFEAIRGKVNAILKLEAPLDDRIDAWKTAISLGELFPPSQEELDYSAFDWQLQVEDFHLLNASSDLIQRPIYKFHQAALYHRDFTLKYLLPKHGLLVV